MSGFRRHIMARLAQQDYIEGYAVQVGGEYPSTITAKINDTVETISVDSSTGYWSWSGEIISLRQCFKDNSTILSVKVRTKSSVDMYEFARRCVTVNSIDVNGVTATDMYYSFGINGPDYNNGYRSAMQSIKLPIISKTAANTSNCCLNARVLTDVSAKFIESGVRFEQSPLTLQSAINVLSALQDLQGDSATITFSATTSALVQADTTAMNLVAQAQANGWTITFN